MKITTWRYLVNVHKWLFLFMNVGKCTKYIQAYKFWNKYIRISMGNMDFRRLDIQRPFCRRNFALSSSTIMPFNASSIKQTWRTSLWQHNVYLPIVNEAVVYITLFLPHIWMRAIWVCLITTLLIIGCSSQDVLGQ